MDSCRKERLLEADPLVRGLEACRALPQWRDWRWQMRHRLRSLRDLHKLFPGLSLPEGCLEAAKRYPMGITPYYASLIGKAGAEDPIFLQAVPQAGELLSAPFLSPDPFAEEAHMPAPGLIQRYPDRALLLATGACAVYCRHCTRKRLSANRRELLSPAMLREAAAYLARRPEIGEVLVSGGDPLTLSTARLERILSALKAVPSVRVIRIGTRVPVVLPMRVTRELAGMLRRYHPLWLNTHFNHPAELTPEAAEACARLAEAGIPLGNQTVLLRGINDDPGLIEELCRGLVALRVRPYYLFQCDLVEGVEHLRTPLRRGIEIMEALRGRLSGLAIPTFVVDTPEGGGKVPLLPGYIAAQSPRSTLLRTPAGRLVSYPEPDEPSPPEKGPAQEDEPASSQAAPKPLDLPVRR